MPGSEAAVAQLVQVEILPASRPQPVPSREMPETRQSSFATVEAVKQSVKAQRDPAPSEQLAQADRPKPAPDTATPELSSPATAQQDAAGRLLAVRDHLERYKYYPASASRRGIAGDVEVGFQLRSDGSAEQVLVLASSGYEILDQAALETVSRAQPFPAAVGHYQFRLSFRRL